MKTAFPARKILIADDEVGIREGIKWVLGRLGFSIVEAWDGVDAQQKFTPDVDLVITDIHMPTSDLTGIDVLKFVRSRSKTPVILMTGHSRLLGDDNSNVPEAHEVLTKPFRSEHLLKTALEALGLPPVAESPAADFAFINIEKYLNSELLEFDIYAQIRDDKIMLIGHQGKVLDAPRIRDYQKRGISIYMRKL